MNQEDPEPEPEPEPESEPKPEPEPVQTQRFPDVPADARYAEAVNAMAATGLIQGYSDGNFHPYENVTYGEFATLLCRIYGLSTDYKSPHSFGSRYFGGELTVCYGEHWAHGAMYKAKSRVFGIWGANCDEADELMNRGETSTWLHAVAAHMPEFNYGKLYVVDDSWTVDNIPDWDVIRYDGPSTATAAIHGWVWSAIRDAYKMGITQGVDEAGTCDPWASVTRAELCQILYNMGISAPACVTYYTDRGYT